MTYLVIVIWPVFVVNSELAVVCDVRDLGHAPDTAGVNRIYEVAFLNIVQSHKLLSKKQPNIQRLVLDRKGSNHRLLSKLSFLFTVLLAFTLFH